MTRIPNWTKLNAQGLWDAWAARYESEETAIAAAIFTANRLVKARAKSTKWHFYQIKDEFIRRHQGDLVEGYKVRYESKKCWDCGGEGCEECGWSGEYRSGRWLYLHVFEIADRRYSFHSYQCPAQLADEPAQDAESFGRRFTAAEQAQLALPMSGLLRALSYVAATRWGVGEVPVEPTVGTGSRTESKPRPTKRVNDRWSQALHRWNNGLPTPAGGFR